MHIKGNVFIRISVSSISAESRHNTHNQGQISSALGVNQEQGWNGENNLNGTIAKRRKQGLIRVVAGIKEDRRAVEGDD